MCKWNSSEPVILQCIPSKLQEHQSTHSIPGPDEYTKTLGLEWNASIHHFRLSVAELPPLQDVTKRVLVSDIADI